MFEERTSILQQIDPVTLVGLALLFYMVVSLTLGRHKVAWPSFRREAPATQAEVETEEAPVAPPLDNPALVVAPYDNYWVTQGPHGFSYGHMAIDLSAGKGAVIKSPISGAVTAIYTDEYGNPTLVIENERYQVTLLHGDYSVAPGDTVALGQPVGAESNHGYTVDMAGNLCAGRDCGYHTHLNIFDKQLGANVNPLDLLQR